MIGKIEQNSINCGVDITCNNSIGMHFLKDEAILILVQQWAAPLVMILVTGAPKECHPLTDLSHKQALSFDNDNMKGDVKGVPLAEVKREKKRCCPYNFDSTICKIIDDRVLCGYNRNSGSPQSKGQSLSLTGDCRLRGGRVECGYVDPPHEGIRRPPATWDADDNQDGNDALDSGERETLSQLKAKTKAPKKMVTKCIENNNHIVCGIAIP